MDKLTLEDWITSSGKYKHRALHKELTDEVKKNAEDYVNRLNRLCDKLHIVRRKFSSGFRPSTVNNKTPGASKQSTHMIGMGGDLEDADGDISFKFITNQDVLAEEGLYLEDPKYTKTWAHTQSRAPKSGKRMFTPV